MDSKSKPSKLSFDKTFMNVFSLLAEGNDAQRNQATEELVAVLKRKQGESSSACSHVDYTITRLVKGMSSPRGVARLGFGQALSQVLRQLPVISVTDILTAIDGKLKVSKTDAKGEQSQVLCGRCLTFIALIQADRMQEATTEDVSKVSQMLHDVGKERQPLQLLVTQALGLLIEKVSSEAFVEGVWPVLKSDLSCGWETATPETLLLLLKSRKYHKDQVKKKFLKKHWGGEDLLAESCFDSLAEIMSTSTSAHPVIHPVCIELVNCALGDPKLFASFWGIVIDEKLLRQDSKRKVLCFELTLYALRVADSAKQVDVLLPCHLVDILVKTLGHTSYNLHSATANLAGGLVAMVTDCSNPEVQVAVVTKLMREPGSVLFDNITHTKTLSSMMQSIKKEAASEVASLLMGAIQGSSKLIRKAEDREAAHTSCMVNLGSLATTVAMATGSEDHLSILQFLLLHALFDVKTEDPALKHCRPVAKKPLSPAVRRHSQEAFYRVLNKLATFHPEGSAAKDDRTYLDTQYEMAQYLQSLLTSCSVSLVCKLPDVVLECWNKMLASVDKIRKNKGKLEAKMSESYAFELLYLHLGLQLFTQSGDAMDALQDVHVCHEKAFQKRRQSMKRSDHEEPAWQEVVTELLLSMLSEGNHLARVVVNSVFGKLCPHMTQASLQLIINVLKPKSEDQDEDQLGFEDDEADEDAESDEAENGVEDSNEDEESSESESEDDEEEEDEEVVNEQFRSALKSALGKAADDSDENTESDSDLDDEAMMRLDDALAAAFKSRVKDKKGDKEKAQQLKHFKLRCMDLIGRVILSNPPAGMLLSLAMPLLEVMEESTKERSLQDLANKADNLLVQLTKPRKVVADPSVDKSELPRKFQELMQFSTTVSNPSVLRNTAATCLMVVRVMLGLETNTGPSPVKTRAKAADKKHKHKEEQDQENLQAIHNIVIQSARDFCEKRDSNVSHTVLQIILQRQPSLMWPVAEDLLKYAVSDTVRVFSRTQTLAMLASMISKKTVGELGPETWQGFASKALKKLSKHLKKLSQEEGCRVKYTEQLLLVIFKCLCKKQSQSLQVPQDMEEDIKIMKGKLGMDGRRICNKLMGILESYLSPKEKAARKEQKQEKKTQKKKRKQEQPDLEEDTEVAQSSQTTTPPKKRKSAELPNGHSGENHTPGSEKKKKKNRTPSAQKGVEKLANGEDKVSPEKKSKSKKHRRKSVDSSEQSLE